MHKDKKTIVKEEKENHPFKHKLNVCIKDRQVSQLKETYL